MKIKTLKQTHPSYDTKRWEELDALAKGGKAFHAKIRHFLPQNSVEPIELYNNRVAQAHYHSYMGSIANLYVSWLFAADFEVKPHNKSDAPTIDLADPFYSLFQEDVGDETDFSEFMRERFRVALIEGKSNFLIQLPSDEGQPPADRKEWEDRDLGRATLKALSNSEVLDWECDERGQYEWVILHSKDTVRKSWAEARSTVVEEWRIYDKEEVYTYRVEYQESKPPRDDDEVALVAKDRHGFHRVPVMTVSIPTEMCIGEQTRDSQLEHFRLDNALSWLIRRTCYAQPVFKVSDESNLPTMGAGYGIVIGTEEDVGWTSPPIAPFDILQKTVEAKRDEIHRVTHTMAQSVDNNAETVGRSADSKEIDAAATRIVLQAYGSYVSKVIEETYETISEARDEDELEWSVTGFSGYDTATVASLIGNAKAARELGIPSEAFHRQMSIKVANAMFAGEDSRLKEEIRGEIMKASFADSATSVSYENDLAAAQAEKFRAEAEAQPDLAGAAVTTAEASKTSAKASVITAKKPVPKPAKPAAKK